MKRWSRYVVAGAAALALLLVPALVSGPSTAGAQACVSGAAPAVDPYPGRTAVAANFETSSLEGLQLVTAGTGAATLSSAAAHSGTCSIRLHTTTDPGSLAKVSLALDTQTREIYADGWFNIATEGPVGNNVPYLRIFSGGVRIMDVFRQNISHELVLRTTSPQGFTYTSLAPNVRDGIWHRLVMHVVPNGPATGVQIWWDGRSVFESNTIDIRATTADTVQLGSEHDQQKGDIYVDDLVVNGGTGDPVPIPGVLPAPKPSILKRPEVDSGSHSGFLAGGRQGWNRQADAT
ncbi:hypothetical protein FFF93_004440 [Arthrobacter sp. KBS0702]|uniref:hypothetical protein n=1 Tax=Arthrobacter sp. KBS0702 TaxID=2578107 RepID=UPI00110E645B|nr:hypothetical protein [Arthrobacter sp. KBS0702]QDW29102.1 hypothetical protein FFF93_004440 [Arthrobacter sp. KBS0702]